MTHLTLGHYFPNISDYRTALLLDASRWPDDTGTRSVFSPAFAKAAALAARFLRVRLFLKSTLDAKHPNP